MLPDAYIWHRTVSITFVNAASRPCERGCAEWAAPCHGGKGAASSRLAFSVFFNDSLNPAALELARWDSMTGG